MSQFNKIHIDINNETVKVGAGVTMRKLYLKLLKYGYTFPGGSCPGVAIGGLSVLMRKYSIACDSLIDAIVILSNGSIVNARNDPKLMWMLKGAGQGLGIVVDFTLKIYKLPVISYDFELTLKNWSSSYKALKLWQNFIKHPPPDDLWMQLQLSYKSIKILGHNHGRLNGMKLPLPQEFLDLFDVVILIH